MIPLLFVCALLPGGLQEGGTRAPQQEWSWDSGRVSSAYLDLIKRFQPEWDAAKAKDDERSVVERYTPLFLALIESGDPDAERWMLEFADWERAAAEPELAGRLLGYVDDLLRAHGEDFRAELLGDPIGEAWWFLHSDRDRLLASTEAYLGRDVNKKARVAIARALGDAIFAAPRTAEDQEHARRLCAIVAADAENDRDGEWAQRIAEILAWQRIGSPVRDISGEDVDGQALRLLDQRGKVVVLEFWGFW